MSSLRYQAVAHGITQHYLAVQDGRKLPTELELADQFAVSRSTIRRALAQLAADGMVERRVGAGTFAARRTNGRDRHEGVSASPRPDQVDRPQLAPLSQISRAGGQKPITVEVIAEELLPVPVALHLLFPETNTVLVSSSRAIYLEGRVVAVLDAYTDLDAAQACAAAGAGEFVLAVPDGAVIHLRVSDAGRRRGRILRVPPGADVQYLDKFQSTVDALSS